MWRCGGCGRELDAAAREAGLAPAGEEPAGIAVGLCVRCWRRMNNYDPRRRAAGRMKRGKASWWKGRR